MAASAYLGGVAPRVIVSGGRRWGSQIEARVMSAVLQDAGVPAGAIVEELCSLSTLENAVLSAAVLRRMDARRAAVVTCPWHMARALENFRGAGVDAIPIPAARVEAPLSRRLYLHAHEVVCSFLDARAMRRADLLSRAAGREEMVAS
ncbi:membrane associated protein [Minicystis rosea]|nr:membrane associated protein [Minicystis rosea]